MTPEEARYAALKKFGSTALVAEDTRAVWVPRWLDECRQDLRYAVRMLRRRPGFAAAAILTLTLGIGGNTAVFSLVHALLLKGLPVERPDELVRLVEERPARRPRAKRLRLPTTAPCSEPPERCRESSRAPTPGSAGGWRLRRTASGISRICSSSPTTTSTCSAFAHSADVCSHRRQAHLPRRLR